MSSSSTQSKNSPCQRFALPRFDIGSPPKSVPSKVAQSNQMRFNSSENVLLVMVKLFAYFFNFRSIEMKQNDANARELNLLLVDEHRTN